MWQRGEEPGEGQIGQDSAHTILVLFLLIAAPLPEPTAGCKKANNLACLSRRPQGLAPARWRVCVMYQGRPSLGSSVTEEV